jgi:heme-degrading monooxygenase HmoA
MFLLQELLKVNQRRQSELIARQHWIHGLMQMSPGFVGAQLSRFLGNPTDYLVLRMWQDEASFLAFRATDEGANYGKNRPEGLFEGVASGRRYASVIESPAGGSGNFIVRSQYGVEPGRGDEFVKNRERHDGLAVQIPGTVYLHTFRCDDVEGDAKNTYLCIARRANREAYDAYLESPQAEEYRKGNVRGLYKTLGTELYEIVDEVKP